MPLGIGTKRRGVGKSATRELFGRVNPSRGPNRRRRRVLRTLSISARAYRVRKIAPALLACGKALTAILHSVPRKGVLPVEEGSTSIVAGLIE